MAKLADKRSMTMGFIMAGGKESWFLENDYLPSGDVRQTVIGASRSDIVLGTAVGEYRPCFGGNILNVTLKVTVTPQMDKKQIVCYPLKPSKKDVLDQGKRNVLNGAASPTFHVYYYPGIPTINVTYSKPEGTIFGGDTLSAICESRTLVGGSLYWLLTTAEETYKWESNHTAGGGKLPFWVLAITEEKGFDPYVEGPWVRSEFRFIAHSGLQDAQLQCLSYIDPVFTTPQKLNLTTASLETIPFNFYWFDPYVEGPWVRSELRFIAHSGLQDAQLQCLSYIDPVFTTPQKLNLTTASLETIPFNFYYALSVPDLVIAVHGESMVVEAKCQADVGDNGELIWVMPMSNGDVYLWEVDSFGYIKGKRPSFLIPTGQIGPSEELSFDDLKGPRIRSTIAFMKRPDLAESDIKCFANNPLGEDVVRVDDQHYGELRKYFELIGCAATSIPNRNKQAEVITEEPTQSGSTQGPEVAATTAANAANPQRSSNISMQTDPGAESSI
ncbi:hypothetical protein PoB_003417500 [Plakobranchus ocellatus]|uniref:Uncharacterized protein n=1 Tax=Plakobranchus ocellatus TaxID=259542 RepID=A0AAV4AK12_9GAST|nr:hypothetical protein PoB_003417500 [Plakobranchus ocellatus]